MPKVTELHVNGELRPIDVEGDRTLLSVLRDDLAFTGAKYGCGEGECGACTVLLEGKPIRSCRTRVGSVGVRRLRTVEGLAVGGELHPVQQAFLDADALQCGYCTGGMILAAVALLESNPNPSKAEIVEAMDGNICRCGTYPRILAAIEKAATVLRRRRP